MKALNTAELERLIKLPKFELHVHLEGFVDLTFWEEMVKAQGTWTSERAQAMQAHFAFKSFPLFLKCFGAVIYSFLSPADFYRLARYAAERLKAQGVVYAEVMMTPPFFVNRGIDFFEMMAEVDRGFTSVEIEGGPQIKLIFDGARNFGNAEVRHCFELAAQDKTGRVIGVGLGGDEVNFPARDFVDEFKWAQAQGLHLTCHAGEAAGAQSIMEAVQLLGAERLGHALGIEAGSALEEEILKNSVALDLCPHSNLTTGVLATLDQHPLEAYLARGHRVSLSSDDPGFFRTDLIKELSWAWGLGGETLVKQVNQSALLASFMPPAQKTRWATEIAQF